MYGISCPYERIRGLCSEGMKGYGAYVVRGGMRRRPNMVAEGQCRDEGEVCVRLWNLREECG